jgi:hypothetical protein
MMHQEAQINTAQMTKVDVALRENDQQYPSLNNWLASNQFYKIKKRVLL